MLLFSQTPSRLSALVSLLIVGFVLSACGYRPLYGQHSLAPKTTQRLSAIDVKPIPDRVGQIMRTTLKQSLRPKAMNLATAYSLNISLGEAIGRLAVEQNSFATRANLTLSASYDLVRKSDGLQLLSGQLSTVSSYNILTSDFATIAARDDARERAVENLAATIHTRLAVYFQGPGAKPPPQLSGNTYR